MPIIKGYIDPYWHEKYLLIIILNNGSMRKHELFDEIVEEQKKRIVLGEKEVVHSKSAYSYWVNHRESQWVISEHEGILELTPLGKWIANSTLGTFFERDNLVDLICGRCAKPRDLVFLKPLLQTVDTNAKGRLFMDLQCPRLYLKSRSSEISQSS